MRARKQGKKGLTRVTVTLRAAASAKKTYQAEFIVDAGAGECRAPASKLKEIGIKPQGTITSELAEGGAVESLFGIAVMEFMGDITADRIIFGADDSEPILSVIALESAGLVLDSKTGTLRRQPTIPLKSAPRI